MDIGSSQRAYCGPITVLVQDPCLLVYHKHLVSRGNIQHAVVAHVKKSSIDCGILTGQHAVLGGPG